MRSAEKYACDIEIQDCNHKVIACLLPGTMQCSLAVSLMRFKAMGAIGSSREKCLEHEGRKVESPNMLRLHIGVKEGKVE